MTIFVEDIFIENFIIFFSLAIFVSKLLGKKEKLLYQIFAGTLAAGFETAGVVLNLGNLGHILLLVFDVLLVVVIGQKGLKNIFVSIVISFVYLFVIDGLKGVLAKFENITIPLKILCALFMILLFKLVKHFYSIKKHKKFEYKVNFYNGQNVFSTIGYLDSGNFLLDTISQKPIVIIDYKIFVHITNINLENLLQEKYVLKNSHYIDYCTIGCSKKMLVFEIDEVEIDGKKADCLIGLNMSGFENGYSALLGVQVLGDMI